MGGGQVVEGVGGVLHAESLSGIRLVVDAINVVYRVEPVEELSWNEGTMLTHCGRGTKDNEAR